PILGIVGGGQLARMLALAAVPLGCRIAVLESQEIAPAAGVSQPFLKGSAASLDDLKRLAASCDVLTLENEFVDASLLEGLERDGYSGRARSATLRITQDNLLQKEQLSALGLPVPPFRAVATSEEVIRAGEEFGWPVVLK